MQKLKRIKHLREKQREDFDKTFVTFGELDDALQMVLAQYDKANVLEARTIAYYLALPLYQRVWHRIKTWAGIVRVQVRRLLRRKPQSEEAA